MGGKKGTKKKRKGKQGGPVTLAPPACRFRSGKAGKKKKKPSGKRKKKGGRGKDVSRLIPIYLPDLSEKKESVRSPPDPNGKGGGKGKGKKKGGEESSFFGRDRKKKKKKSATYT